jgi:hypothetical protein
VASCPGSATSVSKMILSTYKLYKPFLSMPNLSCRNLPHPQPCSTVPIFLLLVAPLFRLSSLSSLDPGFCPLVNEPFSPLSYQSTLLDKILSTPPFLYLNHRYLFSQTAIGPNSKCPGGIAS